MPNKAKKSISIQTQHRIMSNDCLPFTTKNGNIKDEDKFHINYESIVEGNDHCDYVSPEMITFPIQYATQLEIKEEKNEKEEFTKGYLEERDHDYSNKNYADSILIKGEDALNDVDNQENVQIVYNEETNEFVIGLCKDQNLNYSVNNFETESVTIKADESINLEYVRDPEPSLILDEPILIVRPSLFTLNSQLDYNLRVRSSATPRKDAAHNNITTSKPMYSLQNSTMSNKDATHNNITTSKPMHSLQSSTMSNKDAIQNNTLSSRRHHNITHTANSPREAKTVKSYRYAIHNKQVENQMEEYVKQTQEIPVRKPKQIKKTRNIHKCSFCVKGYQTKLRLESHVLRCHTEHEPYMCCICGREFPQKSYIAMHLNAAHSRHKEPYKCELCNMKFDNAAIFGKHMRAHTTRSFKCTICHKQFCRRWNYTSHMRRHNALMIISAYN